MDIREIKTFWSSLIEKNGIEVLKAISMNDLDEVQDHDTKMRLINAKQTLEGLETFLRTDNQGETSESH